MSQTIALAIARASQVFKPWGEGLRSYLLNGYFFVIFFWIVLLIVPLLLEYHGPPLFAQFSRPPPPAWSLYNVHIKMDGTITFGIIALTITFLGVFAHVYLVVWAPSWLLFHSTKRHLRKASIRFGLEPFCVFQSAWCIHVLWRNSLPH